MFLVDTNVISEARKGTAANAGVVEFFVNNKSQDIYLCVQTIGEIRRGVENIRRRCDLAQAKVLETWLNLISAEYGDRVLMFDTECAQLWGCLMSPSADHAVDKQIAAIALIYGMCVVTRNVSDFLSTGVAVDDPFRT